MSARFKLIFATALFALAIPSAASACRIGGTQLLFTEEPESAPREFDTIKVHFTNFGPDVDAWRERTPRVGIFESLIGVAHEPGADAKDQQTYPVYAVVTSCTYQFSNMPVSEHDSDRAFDGEYWLVGRFVTEENGRRFLAVGNHNGRWPN